MFFSPLIKWADPPSEIFDYPWDFPQKIPISPKYSDLNIYIYTDYSLSLYIYICICIYDKNKTTIIVLFNPNSIPINLVHPIIYLYWEWVHYLAYHIIYHNSTYCIYIYIMIDYVIYD